MRLSNLHNRRLAAQLLLLAMVLFVVAFNVHTDDQHSVWLDISKAITNCAHSGSIGQSVSAPAESHCVACELMALGAGNTVISQGIHVATIQAKEPIPVTSDPAICCDIHRTLSSRAPPI
jgi:hypothetical protein